MRGTETRTAQEERARKEAARASFGYRDVPIAEKQTLVDAVFHRVARRYDLMNDLMSGGLHRAWKAAMIAWLSPPRSLRRRPFRLIDVAGGTGDIAFRALEAADGSLSVTVCDINASMLAVGRERAAARGFADAIQFVEGNAEELPFPDRSFDAYTIAFGIRNVPRIDVALAEAYRVLRPGGRFLCLEFSQVDVPLLDTLYERYSFAVIPRLGRLVAGDADSYRYLVESIRRFPNQARFRAMVEAAGFARTEVRNLTGGIAAIHSGWRL